MERTLQRQEKAKAEEEALRGRPAGGDDEWRLEYLKGLNSGLDNQEVCVCVCVCLCMYFLSGMRRSDGI